MTLTGMSKGNTDIWLNDRAEKEAFSDPQCNICHGAGFVHPLSDSGMPDFSKVVQCRCTEVQFQKERITRLQKFSNLGVLSRLTFDNLLPAGKEKTNNQIKLHKTAKKDIKRLKVIPCFSSSNMIYTD